jgi:hypothetical protein
MGFLLGYGAIFQILALVHFARRRPETYWIFIIIFGGGLGALVYLVVEALPDRDLFAGFFGRRKRISEMEGAVALNPSAGNHEELGGLYLDDGKYARAREHFDQAISARTDSVDPFYRRGICEIMLGDFPAAVADLERVVHTQPKYDLYRAAGLLAHAYGKTGQPEKAEALFRDVTSVSTLSETQYQYAEFLASQNRTAEAREWAQRLLDKKRSMPGFQRRRDRPWLRRAKALLRRLPAA